MRLLRYALPIGGATLATACFVAAMRQIENDAANRIMVQVSPVGHVVRPTPAPSSLSSAPSPAPDFTAPIPFLPRPSSFSVTTVTGAKHKLKRHAAATQDDGDSDTSFNARRLDAGFAEATTQARRLLKAVAAGRLTLLNGGRDGDQLRELERSGQCVWPLSPEQIAAQQAIKKAAQAARKTATSARPNGASVPSDNDQTGNGGTESDMAKINGAAQALGRGNTASSSLLSSGKSSRAARSLSDKSSSLALAAPVPPRHAAKAAAPDVTDTENAADASDALLQVENPKLKIENPITRPDPAMLRFLTTLAAHATPARPLEVMSLLRPPYQGNGYRHAGPRNPHSLGMAADVSAYSGHRVVQSDPEACVQTTLAILRDLPPGRYRLGMPKAPEPPKMPALVGLPTGMSALLIALAPDTPVTAPEISRSVLPSRHRGRFAALSVAAVSVPAASAAKGSAFGIESVGGAGMAAGMFVGGARPVQMWPFFPAPETATGENGATTVRWRNEAYAPESEIADPRVRHALEAARRRGVNVYALFPDAADHVHVDVR